MPWEGWDNHWRKKESTYVKIHRNPRYPWRE
jgi:hypothetical protein